MPFTLRAKCVLVGDPSVGKTAISQVFTSDNTEYPKVYSMTTGVELLTKTVTIPEVHSCVDFFIFDSAGKEIFSDIVRKHWDNPSMVVVVYDVTSENSFSSCEKWLERVKACASGVKMPGVLVANKIDLDDRRVITQKAGQEFAHAKGLEYFECSAKDMQNVDQPFMFLANTFYRKYQNGVEMLKNLA